LFGWLSVLREKTESGPLALERQREVKFRDLVAGATNAASFPGPDLLLGLEAL
jgi:hypothetical protein